MHVVTYSCTSTSTVTVSQSHLMKHKLQYPLAPGYVADWHHLNGHGDTRVYNNSTIIPDAYRQSPDESYPSFAHRPSTINCSALQGSRAIGAIGIIGEFKKWEGKRRLDGGNSNQDAPGHTRTD